MALGRFIYGVIKIFLCFKRVVHVRYVSIDDLVMTAPLKKDIATLWSCSGRPGASLSGPGGWVVISSATGRNEWATLTGLSTHALS